VHGCLPGGFTPPYLKGAGSSEAVIRLSQAACVAAARRLAAQLETDASGLS
jgi:hypothetical protein